MYELFSAFFPILTSFSLKPLTRNHSYIMVYYVFLISVMTTVPLGTFIIVDDVLIVIVFKFRRPDVVLIPVNIHGQTWRTRIAIWAMRA